MLSPRLSLTLTAAALAGCGGAGAPASAEDAASAAWSTAALAVDALATVCPPARADELCTALRNGWYPTAGQIVARRVAAEPRPPLLADAAVRWYVRERALALLAWNAQPNGDVDAFFAEHFPAYSDGSFPLAHAAWAPPPSPAACARPTEALIIFVGVLRSTTHREFDAQAAALKLALPCLRAVRVETDSFVPTGPNAAKARDAIAALDAELGPVPLHFLGYSQGVSNALRTLVDYPAIAARVRTVVALNSAAHGSETADALLTALNLGDRPDGSCDNLPQPARDACRAIDQQPLHPIAGVLQQSLASLGFDFGDVDGSTVGDFLRRRVDGLRSLGTAEMARFWRERGAELPTSVLYLSFRSFIGEPWRDLPTSNAWSYALLASVDRWNRENDMQVRLVNQRLGGPLAQVEVVGPAAEGNHWQWELTSNDLSEPLEPRAMADRMPHEALLLAYYQTLHEIGLVLPADESN
jgi:hypothetical protein